MVKTMVSGSDFPSIQWLDISPRHAFTELPLLFVQRGRVEARKIHPAGTTLHTRQHLKDTLWVQNVQKHLEISMKSQEIPRYLLKLWIFQAVFQNDSSLSDFSPTFCQHWICLPFSTALPNHSTRSAQLPQDLPTPKKTSQNHPKKKLWPCQGLNQALTREIQLSPRHILHLLAVHLIMPTAVVLMDLLNDMGDLLKVQAAPPGRGHHPLDVAQEFLRLGPVRIDLLHGALPRKVQGNILLIQVGTIQVRHLRPTARLSKKQALLQKAEKNVKETSNTSNHIHFSSASIQPSWTNSIQFMHSMFISFHMEVS